MWIDILHNYDFYFDDDNINDDIIDNVLVDNLEVECKENM
jgi:hypothetical protein